ncbi:MAG: IS1595 family transposase [Gammaproteobacteria bacterium]|nr:IS1595 family transposase [Gammaproteobacteria bacterium]
MDDHVTISVYQFLRMFPDEEAARVYLEQRRWRGTPVCPHCGCFERITARQGKRAGYYVCRDCTKEFTVRTKSIFERSHVSLDRWLLAMYYVVTARKGISSMQLSKELSITQKSAWFVLSRLREALGHHPPTKLKGVVEIDETGVGGIEGTKHAWKRKHVGTGYAGKEVVMGFRERGGRTIGVHVEGQSQKVFHREIHRLVEPGTHIQTDEHKGYNNLPGYIRSHVKHGAGEYVGAGDVTVNSVESMWAVLKRGIYGVWHQVSVKHLQRYVNEATFRLNEGNVEIPTMQRLEAFVELAFRCRITYRELVEGDKEAA